MRSVMSTGSIAMDIVFDCNALPINDGFVMIHEEKMLPGGSSANVMVTAAGFGMKAYQVGRVGDDGMGARFIQSLDEDNVDSTYMYEVPDTTTMHTYIVTAPGGQHTILANFGTSLANFTEADLPEDILDNVDILYTDMYSCAVSSFLVKKAKKLGKKIVFNMQGVPSFMVVAGTPMEEIEMALSNCDLLIGGRPTYGELVPEEIADNPEASIKYVVEKYGIPDGAIVTLGGDGAAWYDGEQLFTGKAYELESVVDTTGAGDCFLGAVIYAYYERGMAKSEILDFANATAAIKCGKHGPRSKATEEEVNDFRKSF